MPARDRRLLLVFFEEEGVGVARHCLEGEEKEWGREVRGYSLGEKEEAAAGVLCD